MFIFNAGNTIGQDGHNIFKIMRIMNHSYKAGSDSDIYNFRVLSCHRVQNARKRCESTQRERTG